MARVVVDVKNTIGIEQGTITTTGTDSDPTRIHSVGFIALEYTGTPPSALVISATTSTGKTLNVSYVVYNTADYTDISYDPNAWLTNPCTADLSGKSNVHYIATYAKNSNNSNISPSDITAWTITYDDGIVYHAHEGEYPVNDSAMPIVQTDFTRPFPSNLWRIDQSNDGYPYTDLQLGILTYEPPPPPPEPEREEETIVQYDIYCDDKLMHSSVVPENEYKVIDPVLDLQDSAAGSLEFSLPPFNCMYGKCQMMMSTIRVERNGKEIWEGRPVSFKEDMWLNHAVTCEGELAYLNDIYQEQTKLENKTLQQILEYVINAYNGRAAANRQFTLGWIEDEKYTSDLLDITIPFQPTLETINSLCKTYGLHVYMRNTWDENGVKTRRICFKGTDLGQNASQVIEFGTNLTDYAKSYNFAELVTAVLPLGAKSDKAGATVKDTDDTVDAKASGFEQGSIVTATSGNPSGNYDSTSRVRTTNYLTLPTNADSIKVTAALTAVSGVTTQISLVGYNANKEQTFIENEWYNSPHELGVSSYTTTKYYRIVLKYSNSADLTPENVVSCSVDISKKRKGTPYGGTYGRYYVIWPTDGYDSRNDRQHPNPEYYHHAGDIVNISAISDFPGDKSRYFVNEYTLTAETATVYITAQMQGGAGMVVVKNQGNNYFIKKSSKNGMTAWSDFKFSGWYSQFTGEVKMYVGCYDSQSATDDTHGLIIYNSKVVDKGLEEYVTVEGITGNPNISGLFVIDRDEDQYDSHVLPVDIYGRIERKVEWPDAKDAWTLYNNAITYLRSGQFDGLEISLSAIDMAMLGVNCSQLYPGELVMVKCQPYGLEKTMPVSEVKIPLDKPEDTQFNVGDRRKQSLTSVNTATNSQILSMIAEKPSVSAVLSAAKRSAAEYLSDTQNGYVTWRYAEDGHIEAMIVSDTEDYRQSPNGYWIFGKHGIGHIKADGTSEESQYTDTNVAMTSDGKIVADYITAGHMTADHIRGNTLALGALIGDHGEDVSGDMVVQKIETIDNVPTIVPLARINKDGIKQWSGDYWVHMNDGKITFGDDRESQSKGVFLKGNGNVGFSTDMAVEVYADSGIGTSAFGIATDKVLVYLTSALSHWSTGYYETITEEDLILGNKKLLFINGLLTKIENASSTLYSGTFKDNDGNTVHVSNGLITEITTPSNNE
jgi:hypothetical protein